MEAYVWWKRTSSRPSRAGPRLKADEAWQSGAHRWGARTRKACANDLGYPASLVAVTAPSNRSKSDREPGDWLPPRASYSCTYVADLFGAAGQ